MADILKLTKPQEKEIDRLYDAVDDGHVVLFIVNFKHGPEYYTATTKSGIDVAAYHVLSDLKANYKLPEYSDGKWLESEKPDLTVEQLNALPDGVTKRTGLMQWETYNNHRTATLENNDAALIVRDLFDGKLTNQALRVLFALDRWVGVDILIQDNYNDDSEI